MALPKSLKNFNIFIDGFGYAGRVEEVVLPKLARKMEEYRAGGMSGPVDIDMGLEKLEAEITMAEMSRELLIQFGVCGVDGVLMRFRGAAVTDDGTCATNAIEIVMRGRFKEIDLGTAKTGDKNTMKLSATLSRFEYHENDIPLIILDPVNMVELVGGVDRLAEQRNALGV